jgi:hypothetical protein
MKRIIYSLLAFAMLIVVGSGCKKAAKPLSEVIGRVWSAQLVKEGSSTVYTKGATTNIRPGYSNYKLNLSSATSATYTDFDNLVFTGQWAVTDNTLTLSNLNPSPTGTNGTIVFTINSSSETELSLTRTTASQKTGGTLNQYNLVSP